MTSYPSLQTNGHTATIEPDQAMAIARAILSEMGNERDAVIDVDMGFEFIPCHVTMNEDGLCHAISFGELDDYTLSHRSLLAVNRDLCTLQMTLEDLPF